MAVVFLVVSLWLVAAAVVAAIPVRRRFAADIAVVCATFVALICTAIWVDYWLALGTFVLFLGMCFSPLFYFYRHTRRYGVKRPF